MAYDERLAERVRAALAGEARVEERKMFGGLAFMVAGHMACGILGDELIARLGAEATDEALARKHTRPMDFTGRPMRSMVMVAPPGLRTAAALRGWVDGSLAFVRTLPPRLEEPHWADGGAAAPRRPRRR